MSDLPAGLRLVIAPPFPAFTSRRSIGPPRLRLVKITVSLRVIPIVKRRVVYSSSDRVSASSIHSQQVRLRTFSGQAASFRSSFSTASFFASSSPYTMPSIRALRYSKTRSAGCSSGECGGCWMRAASISSYSSPWWPLAPSHTAIPHDCFKGVCLKGVLRVLCLRVLCLRVLCLRVLYLWGLLPGLKHRSNGLGFHVRSPGPLQASLQRIDRQVQIRPLVFELDGLPDFHSSRCPAAPHLANEAQPHFISEKHRPGTLLWGLLLRGLLLRGLLLWGLLLRGLLLQQLLLFKTLAQIPFFQASCTSGSASGDCWRGTFFFRSNRSKTWRIPQ